jgi:hypothetical protein
MVAPFLTIVAVVERSPPPLTMMVASARSTAPDAGPPELVLVPEIVVPGAVRVALAVHVPFPVVPDKPEPIWGVAP